MRVAAALLLAFQLAADTSPRRSYPDPSRYTALRTVTPQESWIRSAVFHPDGRHLLVAGQNKWIYVYDIRTGEQVRKIGVDVPNVFGMSLTPRGETVAICGSNSVLLLDFETGKEKRKLSGHTATVMDVRFSRDGSLLFSGGHDRSARVWSFAEGKETARFVEHEKGLYAVSPSPDGRWLATAGSGNQVGIARLSRRSVRLLDGHTNSVWGVSWHRTSRMVASSSYDGTVRVWSVPEGKPIRKLEGHTSGAMGVRFSRCGRFLATGDNSGTVRLWRVSNGKLAWSRKTHKGGAIFIAFSPDGRHFASTGNRGRVTIWGAKEK